MNPYISVPLAIEQHGQLLNTKVSIEAILVIRGCDVYLVDSAEMPENPQRIPVHCPGLELRLDSLIGGWMGSPYAYMDRVVIDGALEIGTARRYRTAISAVTRLTIFRDGEELLLTFPEKPSQI